MSAIPSPAPLAGSRSRPAGLTVPAPLVTAWRTLVLLGLALFVPGEAARISERL